MIEKRTNLRRAASFAAVATLLSAPVAHCLGQATGAGGWLMIYLAAALSAFAVAAASLLRHGLPLATGLIAVGTAGALAFHGEEILAVIRGVEGAVLPPFALPALAALLAALWFPCVYKRTGGAVAIAVTLASLIALCALSEKVRLLSVVPALVACAVSYARYHDMAREAGSIGAVIPAVLAVVLAIALLPGPGTTWKPLSDAAEKVQALFTDYFRFTDERLAFTIRDQGYDRAGLVNDVATGMLGGPASPTGSGIMTVETTESLLLRGTLRVDYTGYSWEDDSPRARDLYYNLLRESHRSRVFGSEIPDELYQSGAFRKATATVTFLDEATSTLFVPGRLTDFSMSLDTAVYYNSAGEMFLSRNVEMGDTYTFTAAIPGDYEAMRLATVAAGETDPDYSAVQSEYTQLPNGISEQLYALVATIRTSSGSDSECAAEIQRYLALNCAYTLTPDYPPEGVDFVSWFVLEEKAGYCSSFASAMAVMCRIAGIPSRYVEGYRVTPSPDGTARVTGEDAHAWVEVYFPNIGWISYDPTPPSSSDGDGAGGGESDGGEEQPHATPTPTPTPTPEPTQQPTSDPDDPFQPITTPTPEPEDQTNPFEDPSPTLPPDDPFAEDRNEPEADDRDFPWWILLVVAALAGIGALTYFWSKKRLDETDPGKLVQSGKDTGQASLVVYRAILTLLAQMGQTPLAGETPAAFAKRASQPMGNTAFVRFSSAISRMSYANAAMSKAELADGLRAYASFESRMRKGEKMRHRLHRILRGIGNTEIIP